MKRILISILLTVLLIGQTACTNNELANVKLGVDSANDIVQSDQPIIDTLAKQGKITLEQADSFDKIAVRVDAFNKIVQHLTTFPPKDATDLINQANNIIDTIGPIVADPSVHPLIALALGGVRAGLTITVKRLGGKTPSLVADILDRRNLRNAVADLRKSHKELETLAVQ